jgi:gliding motility-associated-like protein
MNKLLITLFLGFGLLTKLFSQAEYSNHEIFTTGLNVPNQMVFNTDGILFVANHTFASYSGEYSNTIARIDESGNKSVFIGGYTWPSGLTIDVNQNLYFTQNNAGNTVYKVSPNADVQTFVSLPHAPGPITIFDDGTPKNFALYTISHWGSQGVYKTDINGVATMITPGAYGACQLSRNGKYLYLVGLSGDIMYRFDIDQNTLESWNTELNGYQIWAATLGPDQLPYFIARSVSDSLKLAVFRINGYNDVTELLVNMPLNSEFNDVEFKRRDDVYDIYLTEIVNGERTNPEANRVIIVRDIYSYLNTPGFAGPVSGPTEVCPETSGNVYSVDPIPNATGYIWTLPAGATITEGWNTNVITVSFSQNAQSGSVTVYGTNEYGVGPGAPPIYITVNPLPANLGEPINPPLDLTSGLVAYYPFNGNANDESGNGNHGVVNGALLTNDRFGINESAYSFDGNQTHIFIPASNSLDINENISISTWFVTSEHNLSGQQQIFWRGDAKGGFDPYSICFSQGNLQFRRDISADLSNHLDYNGDLISFEDFHHVVGTYNGLSGQMSLFLNGLLIEDKYLPGISDYPTASFWNVIGSVDYGNWQTFNGKIDDIRIYNRALTPEEVLCLYNGDCQQLILTATQGETTLCRGESSDITLFNAQPGVAYQLMDNNLPVGQPQVGNADTLIFQLTDIITNKAYTILATDTTTGCSVMLDSVFALQVVPLEAIILAELSHEYAPATVMLTSTSQFAEQLSWLLNGQPVSESESFTLELTEPGIYEIVLEAFSADPYLCADADTLMIELLEKFDYTLDFPSAFSPNADGINDVFIPEAFAIESYTVWVKDAWGITVAEFDHSGKGWDGTLKHGAEAPPGAYVYQADAIDLYGVKVSKGGIVYLIRDMIDLAPNPVDKEAVIYMNGRLKGRRSLEIYALTGNLIIHQEFDSENHTLDLTGILPGVYIIRVTNGIDVVLLKLIRS